MLSARLLPLLEGETLKNNTWLTAAGPPNTTILNWGVENLSYGKYSNPSCNLAFLLFQMN